MYVQFKIIFLSLLALLSGCTAQVAMKSMTAPISESRTQLVKDGQTTKTDILTMFGSPNGFIQGVTGQQGFIPQSSHLNTKQNIMHYKDCVIKGSGSGGFLGFSSKSGAARHKCKVFTALLNEQDVVVAHAFIEDNQVTAEKLSVIKPNKTSRKDVIRQLGGPSVVTTNNNDEIYLYKDCIHKGKSSGLFSMLKGNNITSTDESCQQASIVINIKTGVVKKVDFYPYLESE
jgi:outer membrane protein assembly factor BamE (lipoprotein component of BamABCDE complex)